MGDDDPDNPKFVFQTAARIAVKNRRGAQGRRDSGQRTNRLARRREGLNKGQQNQTYAKHRPRMKCALSELTKKPSRKRGAQSMPDNRELEPPPKFAEYPLIPSP